jgi:serine/threonine-protein kinase RsbW
MAVVGGADVTEEGTASSAIRTLAENRGVRETRESPDAHDSQDLPGNSANSPNQDEAGSSRSEGMAEPSAAGAQEGMQARDQVTVKMPADGAYLSVLRTATAGLAARLDFTLDEIEDMRIAVDEACAMLLSQAIPGSFLDCDFRLGQDSMTISVSVRCLAPRVPASDTFAWTVLSALAGSVDAKVGPGDVLTIVLRKSRDSSRSV